MAGVIKVDDTEYNVDFTFNSFKYMEDLDLNDLNELDSKPFKIIKLLGLMLLGGLNYDPKVQYSMFQVDKIVEASASEGTMMDVMEVLMERLQESDFFKSLQA